MANEGGTPSDQLLDVIAIGGTDVTTACVSMSARHPDGSDAEYLAWHALDHRPEQHRLAGLRGSLRLVSTPACRAARAASDDRYDAVDHVMAYLFADAAALRPFRALGAALAAGNRMPLRLPSVELAVYELAGLAAAPRVVVGADVIPWRPGTGAYLLIETGTSPANELTDVPGVAGVWWFTGVSAASGWNADTAGMQLTYCHLDDDPVPTAERLRPVVEKRWNDGRLVGHLAAPFHTPVEYDWERYLP